MIVLSTIDCIDRLSGRSNSGRTRLREETGSKPREAQPKGEYK